MKDWQEGIKSYYSDLCSSDLEGLRGTGKGKKSEVIYEVSVVMLTYNPSWEKMKATLNSIIIQKNISVQLVISDDGSKENFFQKVKDYLDHCGFLNYLVISNTKNEGTVINTLRGVEATTSKYIKIISPGDCLIDDNILYSWIKYMNVKDVEWSFSDAIYYKLDGDIPCIVQGKAHPTDVRPYIKGKKKTCRWNYVVCDDIALGAAIMAKRQVMITYLKRIVGKVKYAEDNIGRLMMFDGVIGIYFPYPAIYYESGTGISNLNSDVWKIRLRSDWDATTNEMVSEFRKNDGFQRDALRAMNTLKSGNKLSRVLVKGKIGMYLYRKFFWRKTKINNNTDSNE